MFHFKQFTVRQEVNPQKVGTDSMLLGALVSGNYRRILDIGTGTGILALMMAQKYPAALITAVELDQDSLDEARQNFQHSPFSDRILAVHSDINHFGSMEKYDLIISNPPYFNNSYLSESVDRNRARQTASLSINELYQCSAELLHPEGKLMLIIPHTELRDHLEAALDHELYLAEIVLTPKPDGGYKRAVLTFSFQDQEPVEKIFPVKDSAGRYSNEYITLTKDFYTKDLGAE